MMMVLALVSYGIVVSSYTVLKAKQKYEVCSPVFNIVHLKSSGKLRFVYFHSLEVVDRVSETQLQVGENSCVENLDFRVVSVHPLSINMRTLAYPESSASVTFSQSQTGIGLIMFIVIHQAALLLGDSWAGIKIKLHSVMRITTLQNIHFIRIYIWNGRTVGFCQFHCNITS